MSNYGSESGPPPPGDQSNIPTGGYTPAPGPPQPGLPPQPTQYGPPPGYAPPPGGPQMGMTGMAPPPRRRSPLLIIGIIVVAFLLLCGVGVALLIGGVFAATQPVANAGDAYMTALRDADYNKAFDLSTPSLQQEAGNADGLKAALSSKKPASWSFTSRNISNNQGSLSGTTSYADGTTGTVDMVLNQVGNDWKVAGISLK
jgi:hypothetical protein